jgi:hypothetical protein
VAEGALIYPASSVIWHCPSALQADPVPHTMQTEPFIPQAVLVNPG